MNLDTIYEKALSVTQNHYEFQRILGELKNVLEFEHRLRNGKAVVVESIAKAVFFGDVHGDIETLYILCKKVDLYKLLKNNWFAVFLGDYIDRGYNQIETLAFIAMLKTENPSNVITLRGNHEPYKHLIPYPHDYPEHLKNTFGEAYGTELYELSREIFDLMPLALYVPGKLFAVHGGPPINRIKKFHTVDDILSIEGDDEAVEDILWSDPIETDIEYVYSYRGAGKLWGTPITTLTLKKLDIELIVRGHEPVEGYRFSHNGRIITIFTMKGYYGNISASCLKLHLDKVSHGIRAVEEGIVSV